MCCHGLKTVGKESIILMASAAIDTSVRRYKKAVELKSKSGIENNKVIKLTLKPHPIIKEWQEGAAK